MRTPVTYTAAWIPADEALRDWDGAAAAAVAWIEEQAARLGATPLLVTPHRNQQTDGPPAIVDFAARYPATTPRSDRHAIAGGRRPVHGPVLAFVPDYPTMELAISYAHRAALAVVELSTDPLIGWAIEAKAVNLLTGRPTVDPRTEYQRTELDHIDVNGNNDWTRGYGADRAAQVLRDLQRTEPLDPDVIVGVMLARGHSHKGVARLAKLIEAATPGTTPTDPPDYSSRNW